MSIEFKKDPNTKNARVQWIRNKRKKELDSMKDNFYRKFPKAKTEYTSWRKRTSFPQGEEKARKKAFRKAYAKLGDKIRAIERRLSLVEKPRKSSPLVKHYAAKLQKNTPNSELWFLALYKEHKMLHHADEFNQAFENTIPDVINHELKYIIEVQDPTHHQPEREAKDFKKKKRWESCGYRVFYCWAWNHKSFDLFLEYFKEFRLRIKS